MAEVVIVPRNFKLLDELEEAEKPKGDRGADVSLGMSDKDDVFLCDWNASLVQGAGGGEPRLWFLTLHAGDDYPSVPPTIKFQSRVNLDCVGADGVVNPSRLPYLATWDRSKSLHGALSAIKNALSRASRSQPEDGLTY